MKWGIFGTGGIATQFASDFTYTVDAGELFAVASRDEKKAQIFADKFGAKKSYGSYEALIADDEIDVCYIGLPNHLHYPIAEALIKRKKHVLCEKPLTMTAAQTEKLVALARENNVFFMEAIWTRFFPTFKKVKEWIDSGKIGKVHFMDINFGIRVTNKWRQAPEFGGGAILDIGIYTLQETFAILGTEYKALTGTGHLNDAGVDMNSSFSLMYPDGSMSKIACSFEYLLENGALIAGEKGKIEVPGEWWHPDKAILYTGKSLFGEYEIDDIQTFEDEHPGVGMQFEADHVADCIRKGLTESPDVTLDETIKLAHAMELLRKKFGVVYPQDNE